MKRTFLHAAMAIAMILSSSHLLAHNAMKNVEYKIGQIKIENPYARETVPGQKAASGFMKIQNNGVADQLIAASSTVAGEIQLHTMSMDGTVMKMRELQLIEVPKNSAIELKPGGLHMMFIDLKSSLKAGESIPVKLKFQKAGEVEIKVLVREISAGSGRHMHH